MTCCQHRARVTAWRSSSLGHKALHCLRSGVVMLLKQTMPVQVDRNGFPVVRYPSDFEMEPLEGWVKYELMREDKLAATAA